MCALEAMALGVPIVSTPTDGLCELVSDGINGYLSDCDDILAEKVVDIVTDSIHHSTLSSNIKEKSAVINDTDAYKTNIFKVYKNCK